MTKPAKNASATKVVETYQGGKLTVPASTTIGGIFATNSSLIVIGKNCTFGANTYIDAREIGEGCTFEDEIVVRKDCSIGNHVTIGSNSYIAEQCRIADNVTIGERTHLEPEIFVQPGVIIPDDWRIPRGAIVNPGLNGFPVVIMPATPALRCNVTASNRR